MQAVVFWSAVLLAAQIDLANVGAADSTATEIPLGEIWALNMPGTRDIDELEPGAVVGKGRIKYGPLTLGIIKASQLIEHAEGRDIKPNGPGFAVSGIDLEALRTAHSVLTGKEKRPEILSGEITLVFHTLSSGTYVHLDSVERNGNKVTINYHFATHPTSNFTTHLALIPLGTLPAGAYHVEIKQGPVVTDTHRLGVSRFDTAAWERDLVCKSFHFEVE